MVKKHEKKRYKVVMKAKDKLKKGILYMGLSSVSIAILSLFIKLGMGYDEITLLVFLRFCLPFILLIPLALYKKILSFSTLNQELRKQLVRGSVVCISQYSFFFYLTKASLLDASMIFNLGMIFIVLIMRFFYKHPVSSGLWIALIISFLGTALILKPDRGVFDRYSFIGLLAAISMAISQVIYSGHAGKGDTFKNMFYFLLVPSLITAAIFFGSKLFEGSSFSEVERILIKENPYRWLYVFGIAFCSISIQSLRGRAYYYANPATLAPIMYVAIIFAAFFDYTVFHKVPDFVTLVGVVLIVLGSILPLFFNTSKRST